VSFAARKVELSRQIDGRRSTYQLFAAAPEAAGWVPSYLFFDAEFLVLSHRRGPSGRFNPSSLAHGRIPAGWSLVHRTVLGSQPLARVTTSDPLFVNMLGPTPIGAWIPARSGHVRLGFHQGLTANAPLEGELTEHDVSPSDEGALSHPLADFLGPDVAVWSEDAGARVETENTLIYPEAKRPTGHVVLVLFIRRPPFATRIAELPEAAPEEVTPPEQIDFPEPSKTRGPYRMVLKGKPLASSEYHRMQMLMSVHNTFWLKHLTGYFPSEKNPGKVRNCQEGTCEVFVKQTLQKNQAEKFRYPPRPPTKQGFTIFGPLSNLHLSDAEGAFASLDHPLLAPTEMRLHQVEVIGPSDEAEIPVPATEGEAKLDLSVSGHSTVAGATLVQGDSFDWSAALLVAGTIAGLLGLYFAAATWVNRP
jgi:hypothetical protein